MKGTLSSTRGIALTPAGLVRGPYIVGDDGCYYACTRKDLSAPVRALLSPDRDVRVEFEPVDGHAQDVRLTDNDTDWSCVDF
jgi:hypothetical protein